jgi:hypothetical protein
MLQYQIQLRDFLAASSRISLSRIAQADGQKKDSSRSRQFLQGGESFDAGGPAKWKQKNTDAELGAVWSTPDQPLTYGQGSDDRLGSAMDDFR